MSFTIRTTQIIVLEETQAPGYPPMLLPWEKHLEDIGTTARIGGGVIPAHSTNLEILLSGADTVTTLWFYPEATMDVSLGAGNADKITVNAGGCIGFSRGGGPGSGELLRVTYDGDEDSSYTVVWGGS